MALTKARKEELVADYVETLDNSSAFFLTEYKGLDVKTMNELRHSVREADGKVSVTKNTLLRTALEQSGRKVPTDLLSGQTATTFALGEAPTLAKALVDYAKKEDLFTIKGGMFDGRILSTEDVEALAKLPSLDQLRGQLAGLISAPARDLASVVASGVRQVVNVIDAYSKKEEEA